MKTTKTEVTADLVIKRKGTTTWEIVLIKRKNEPFAGSWALPGGFVETNETVLAGAKRELKEETGISLMEYQLNFIGYFDEPDRDPRGRLISFAFEARVDSEVAIKAGDDAGEVRWFAINELPELGFDHHRIIEKCFNRAENN